jgi:hypothetical protein
VRFRRERRRAGVLPALGATILLVPAAVAAATLRVGPDKPYRTVRAAAQAARDGDLVEVDAGLYSADVATWSQDGVVVRAVGGRAHLRADGAAEAGKGIWVISGADLTFEGFEFSGAQVPDGNGAGIRAQGSGRLVVRDCWFHDNQNGILGGADSLHVEASVFHHNGTGDGRTHNMYVDHGGAFVLRFSDTRQAVVGHNVKSRALRNYILYNRILDGADGTASYSVDLPQGGRSVLVGNVIQQGPATSNPAIVAYAAESAANGVLDLSVAYNTLVNTRTSGGTFVQMRSGTVARIAGNIFYGPGTRWSSGTSVNASTNYSATALDNAPGFAAPLSWDYRLTAASPAGAGGIVGAGADPGSTANGFDLKPRFHYVHEARSEPRPVVGGLDLGAFELGTAPTDTVEPGVDAGGPLQIVALGPNPVAAGSTAALSFRIAARQRVHVRVYNAAGALVRTLLDADAGPGLVEVTWDGSDRGGRYVAAGLYFYRVECAAGVRSRGALVLR